MSQTAYELHGNRHAPVQAMKPVILAVGVLAIMMAVPTSQAVAPPPDSPLLEKVLGFVQEEGQALECRDGSTDGCLSKDMLQNVTRAIECTLNTPDLAVIPANCWKVQGVLCASFVVTGGFSGLPDPVRLIANSTKPGLEFHATIPGPITPGTSVGFGVYKFHLSTTGWC